MKQTFLPFSIVLLSIIFGGCTMFSGKSDGGFHEVSAGRGAIIVTDLIAIQTAKDTVSRSSSALGVFVSEYLSRASVTASAQGAIDAIGFDTLMMGSQQKVSDPDFELLQALADALQVDVADLLNRSDDREQTLTTYTEALTNVATRGNERFKQLSSATEELDDLLRAQKKELSTAERDLKKALSNKDFSGASELQKVVLEKQGAVAETDLQLKELEDISSTLDQLLTLYGEKILAIEQNREPLISGMKVVDVPGIEDLKLIERKGGSSRKKSGGLQGIF